MVVMFKECAAVHGRSRGFIRMHKSAAGVVLELTGTGVQPREWKRSGETVTGVQPRLCDLNLHILCPVRRGEPLAESDRLRSSQFLLFALSGWLELT